MEKAKLEWAKAWLEAEKNLYINGSWAKSVKGNSFKSINPTNGQTLAVLQEAGSEDVNVAVESAKSAFLQDNWRKMPRRERSSVLQKIGRLIREHRAELATLESLDNGKTYVESYQDDLPESADVFDYYAGWIDKIYGETCPVEEGFVNFTRREPLGVCGLIIPWNFPLLLACWKIAPALAMGNTVVVKPSPFTSLTLVRLAEILHENAVLPKGVFNLVMGNEECGSALSTHSSVAKISFTGSTQVGKKIVEASGKSNLKAVSLELGGKSPNIIFADTPNMDAVIDRCFTAMFCHKGEKCSEPTRFFIEDSVYDTVSAKLILKAQNVRCGDPFDDKTTQGPQCHEAHLNKILEYIRIGKAEGATLLVGGERDTNASNAEGYFLRPTIFGDVKNSMRIAQEEIFGPVLVLIRFKTEAEAIEGANDSIYGLAAGLYTQDISRGLRVANALQAGMVFVNHYGCYDFASPFGGVKQSGWGKEMAIHSLEAYTQLKSVWIRY